MVHSLLSLMLVATQVLSGNSAPLYLCLEADGSICVDFGPDTCGCCHGDLAADDCADHELCDHHPAAPLTAHAEHRASEDCPCRHEQISEPQTATVQRSVSVPLDQHLLAPLAIVPAVFETCTAATCDEILFSRRVDGASCALAERASVMLRC